MNNILKVFFEASVPADVLERIYDSLTSSNAAKALDDLEQDLYDVGRNLNIQFIIDVIKENASLADFQDLMAYGLIQDEHPMQWHQHYAEFFIDRQQMITVAAVIGNHLGKFKSSIE